MGNPLPSARRNGKERDLTGGREKLQPPACAHAELRGVPRCQTGSRLPGVREAGREEMTPCPMEAGSGHRDAV